MHQHDHPRALQLLPLALLFARCTSYFSVIFSGASSSSSSLGWIYGLATSIFCTSISDRT